jgi:chitodextrinase
MTRLLPRLLILILAGLFGLAGCDRSSPSPAAPTPAPAPSPGAGPQASFKLTVDSLGSQEALTGASEVTVDAGASTGEGLRYLVDFGDGFTSTQAVARHVYTAAGTYRITVTLTDGTGRIAAASRDLAVASPLGVWLYSGYLTRTKAVEVRTLTLTAQDGATIRGTLSRFGAGDSPVTGSLTSDRRITLTADRLSETLEGVVPSVLTGNAALSLAARGGPVTGETLVFKPRPGEPTGTPPDSVLHMRFFSFSAPFGIKQISPIRFDASPSRGEGLTYFLEFGDGEVSQAATAVHPIDKVGEYTARLTVVDRFGRANSETTDFEVRSLVTEGYYVLWDAYPRYTLVIQTQNGTAITGGLVRYDEPEPRGRTFSGTADADGQVRVVLSDSAGTLVGTLALPWVDYESNRLVLTYLDGPHKGETLTFHFRNGY